jgi:hypothetical protein
MAERTGLVTDLWPEPPRNMIERLKHVLDIWSDYPDNFIIVLGTAEAYGPGVWTGLTMGDLRTLYGREKLGADTVVYGSAADRLAERLRGDIAKHGKPPGTSNEGN